ncbi:MAG: protein kinase [Planctomyces sp.]|nr:protein kinase [Planctomyces sp.]
MASESEIFQKVLAANLQERDSVLVNECGSDAMLAARIRQLLQAHEQADESFMRPASSEPETTVIPGPSDKSGARIGHYKLLQRIGEGGFGEVYMAEQEFPVTRKVAIKVIKPGMGSREVIARFESERQALALMEHPNIAQVFDAGTTDTGQPYFVMELVRGIAITDFCDRNQMSFEERLKLFISVCNAIQHAHFKGIIHRDIKPSNVLVTLFDGVPVVKVIDFGVAKATAQKLTEKTLFTAFGQMIGTPAYMSPEQAEMSGLDIDTRSDVYSLGVLLYELLTGSTPLDLRKLREAGFAKMQQMIADQEPQRPSLRISSLGQEAASLADNRNTDLKRWVQALQGDLDWIVLKTLERDRNRRYPTPGSLAADLERYLNGDAIEARAPSLWSRVQRFCRKHRGAVLSVSVVMVVLILATALSTFLAWRAIKSEQIATLRTKEADQSRRETLEALFEAQKAKERAEGLTAKIAASAVTLEFSETNLLKLAAQLRELSPSQRRMREYIKWYLYGALQFLASGSGHSPATSLHQSEWTLHAIHDGTLLASESSTDLSMLDVKTGQRIWHLREVFPGGKSVYTATIVQETVLAASDGLLCGLSKTTGEPLWSHQHPLLTTGDMGVPDLDTISGGPSGHAEWIFLDTAPVELIEIASGKKSSLPDLQGKEVTDYLWNRSRSLLMIRLETGRTLVFDPGQGRLLLDHVVGGKINACVFCETDDVLAMAMTHPDDGTQQIYFWRPGWSQLRANKSLLVNFEPDTVSFSDRYTISFRKDAESDWGTEIRPGAKRCWLSSRVIEEAEESDVRTIEAFVCHANEDWLLVQTDDADAVESQKLLNRRTLNSTDLSTLSESAPGLLQKLPCHRFLVDHHRSVLFDVLTGLEFPGYYWNRFQFDESSGLVLCGNPGYFDLLMPLDIEGVSDSDLVLLTELTICGELGNDNLVVPWDEERFAFRLEEARRRGVFSTTSPHFQSFLTQPGFWQARRFFQHLSTGSSFSKLVGVLDEFALRVPNFRGVSELLRGVSQQTEISPHDRLRLEILIAKKWPEQYANTIQYAMVAFDYPGKLNSEYSDLIFAATPDLELADLLLQVSEFRKTMVDGLVNANQEEIEAWCLAAVGKLDQALERITNRLETLDSPSPSVPATQSDGVAERNSLATRLKVLRYLLLTKFRKPDAIQQAAGVEAAKSLGASTGGMADVRDSWQEFSDANPDSSVGVIWRLVFPDTEPSDATNSIQNP